LRGSGWRSICDFNGIAQGLPGFLFRPKTGVFQRTIRHDNEAEQVARLLISMMFIPSDDDAVEKPELPALNLGIVYRPTNSIKPEPRNARTHSKKQVAEIAASVRQFGFTNPLLIDVNGVIIAGHGRLLAAKSIGLDLLPTITCRISTRRKGARCALLTIRLRLTQAGTRTF
jgi:hypothetical protein